MPSLVTECNPWDLNGGRRTGSHKLSPNLQTYASSPTCIYVCKYIENKEMRVNKIVS